MSELAENDNQDDMVEISTLDNLHKMLYEAQVNNCRDQKIKVNSMILRGIKNSCQNQHESNSNAAMLNEPNQIKLDCKGSEMQNFNHKMTDADLKALCFGLEGCISSLVHIDISQNNITENSILTLARVLTEASSIKSVVIKGNDLSGDCVDMLISSLEKSESIRQFDLSFNQIGSESFASLAKMLMYNTSLIDLDISNNNFDVNCLIELMSVMNLYNKTLRVLKIDNQKQKEVGQEIYQHVTKMLKNNNVIESMSLRKFGLKQDGLQTILQGMFENRSLIEIDLGANQINVEAAQQIKNFIVSKECRLRRLYLDCNNIGSKGAKYLAQGLAANQTLQVLDIRNNGIDKQGICRIAECLNDNDNLRVLFLWGNEIEHDSLSIMDMQFNSKSQNPKNVQLDFDIKMQDQRFYASKRDVDLKYLKIGLRKQDHF